MRWVEKYNNDGEIKRYNKKPVAYKITKDQVKYALKEINKNKNYYYGRFTFKNKKQLSFI